MSRLMSSIPMLFGGTVLALGLTLSTQSAHAQLGGVGGAVGGAADAAGSAAEGTAGAATEANVQGEAAAEAAGTEARTNVDAEAGAEARTNLGDAAETVTDTARDSVTDTAREAADQAERTVREGREAARDAVGEAAETTPGAAEAAADAGVRAGAEASRGGAKAWTAADIGTAIGAALNAADNRLRVGSVQQDGIFANTGIRSGDEIVAVGDQRVTSRAQLLDRLRLAANADSETIIRVRRNGELQEMTVDLGPRLHIAAKVATDMNNLGGNATADAVLRTYLGTTLSGQNGLVIDNVQPGSLAARANLTGGDEILAVAGQRVTAENFYARLQADLLEDGRADIRIRRDGQVYRAPITLCR